MAERVLVFLQNPEKFELRGLLKVTLDYFMYEIMDQETFILVVDLWVTRLKSLRLGYRHLSDVEKYKALFAQQRGSSYYAFELSFCFDRRTILFHEFKSGLESKSIYLKVCAGFQYNKEEESSDEKTV